MTPLSKQPARLNFLLCIALVSLCFLAFYHVLSFDFIQFDDDIEITTNAHIRNLTLENMRWMFTNTDLTQRYIPLSWLAWSFVIQFFSPRPMAFHALSLLVHIANMLLLFGLIRSILRRTVAAFAAPRDLSFVAAIAAGVWAVHPLRVEVVAWATQVRFAEATFFALISTLLYFFSVDRAPAAPHRSSYFWLSVFAYVMSIFFYPNAIGLVALFPLLDLYFFQRSSPYLSDGRRLIQFSLEKVPFVLPAIFILAITLYGRFTGLERFRNALTTDQFDIPHRIMQAAYVLIYYLWKPFDFFHISPIYTQLVAFNPFSTSFVLSLLALLLITVLAFAYRTRWPSFFLLWTAHLFFLLPVGGYFEHPYFPSDRYSYLDGTLFSVLLATLLIKIVPFRGPARPTDTKPKDCNPRALIPSKALILLTAATLIPLAVLSNHDSRLWYNSESFFQSLLTILRNDPCRGHPVASWQLLRGSGRPRPRHRLLRSIPGDCPRLPAPHAAQGGRPLHFSPACDLRS